MRLTRRRVARAGIVPGVERGLGPAGSRNCSHQADTWVFARSPLADISVVGDRGGNHFGMRRCHALGHGAPHPAQCLGRTCLGETFGGPLDVGTCDGAAGSGGLYGVEIDIELVCESTHRRKHLKHSRRCRLGRSLGHRSLLLAGVELADYGAGILLGALGKFDQGSADFHQITFGPEHPRNAATPR